MGGKCFNRRKKQLVLLLKKNFVFQKKLECNLAFMYISCPVGQPFETHLNALI